MTAGGAVFDPGGLTCPVCGSSSLSRFSAHAFDAVAGSYVSVVECVDCTFAWQFPVARSPAESASFFTSAYEEAGANSGSYFDAEFKCKVAQLEVDFVATLPVNGRRMLDVGAGAGLFARAAAAAGWHVTAIDPAIDPACLADTSVRMIRGVLDDLADDERFDVITLWDVIEHWDDPRRLLAAVKRRLKVGGWLVVETGNYKSVDRVLGGLNHWIYQLDHRWYLAPDSVERLLTQAQLTDLTYADRVLRPGWHGSAIHPEPTFFQLIRNVVHQPRHAPALWRRHGELRRGSKWAMSGIPIFCVAARRA